MSGEMRARTLQRLPEAAAVSAIVAGRHSDPFSVLGPHIQPDGSLAISVFAPDADAVEIIDDKNGTVTRLDKVHSQGFFFGTTDAASRTGYRVRKSSAGRSWEGADPYAFGPTLGELDLHL